MQPLLLLVQTYCKTIEGVVVTREDGEMAVVARCEVNGRQKVERLEVQ
jgi:hypothetical protein